MRATERGLKALFGCRPFVWQQYALLRCERFTRFQADHERDFSEIDFQHLSDELFDKWLHQEENADFYALYMSYSQRVRDMLRDHLITPFELLDAITEDEEWDFADDDMSVYTYLSVLGGGLSFAMFCLGIQLIIPMILALNAIDESKRFTKINTPDDQLFFQPVTTTFEQVCTGTGPILGRVMVISVFAVYLLTVIPEVLNTLLREGMSIIGGRGCEKASVWSLDVRGRDIVSGTYTARPGL